MYLVTVEYVYFTILDRRNHQCLLNFECANVMIEYTYMNFSHSAFIPLTQADLS